MLAQDYYAIVFWDSILTNSKSEQQLLPPGSAKNYVGDWNDKATSIVICSCHPGFKGEDPVYSNLDLSEICTEERHSFARDGEDTSRSGSVL